VTPSGATVDFFGIDTNGAQISVRKKMPHMENELHENKKWLAESLAASDATWKIVFAHHPLYTKSRDHGCEGRRIRDPEYVHYKLGVGQGYALEDVLVEGHVDAYFAGHEHVFEHHFARGIHYFVCGSTGTSEIRFYGGEDKSTDLTWYDKARDKYGFVTVSISKTLLEVVFNDVKVGEIYRIKIEKPG